MSIFYRFMSMKEFSLMSSGCEIVGKSHFTARTASTGVCFLAQLTEVPGCGLINAEIAYNAFLRGVVSGDVCVKFSVADDSLLRESYGVYSGAYFTGDDYDVFCATEYCVPSYSRDVFTPVAYAIPCGDMMWDWWSFR